VKSSNTTGPCEPEWNPPAHINDPIVRRRFIDRATWMRALRGRIPKAHDRLVAMAFATYGNSDGSRNYPGHATLAEELFVSESTVKRSLAWLAENGWLARTERGDRWAKKADVWQLTLPAPVAAELGRWDPEKHGGQWMQRPVGEPKRPGVRCRPLPRRQLRQGDTGPKEEIEVRKDVDRGSSLDLPPEPDQSLYHHADLPDRARTDVRAAEIDPDEEDVDESIADALAEELGHEVGGDTRSLIFGMLESGCHPKFVYNAARCHELGEVS